jgi:hypothetical protein
MRFPSELLQELFNLARSAGMAQFCLFPTAIFGEQTFDALKRMRSQFAAELVRQIPQGVDFHMSIARGCQAARHLPQPGRTTSVIGTRNGPARQPQQSSQLLYLLPDRVNRFEPFTMPQCFERLFSSATGDAPDAFWHRFLAFEMQRHDTVPSVHSGFGSTRAP